MKLKLLLLLLLFQLVYTFDSFAQAIVKIMAYNVLEYKTNASTDKKNALKTVIDATDPDIFVGVEIYDNAADADHFKDNILNHAVANKYVRVNQPIPTAATGNDNGKFSNFLYYKPEKFTSSTPGTIINESGKWPTLKYELTLPSNNKLIIYGVHLTSGTDGAQRIVEATAIRNSTVSYEPTDYFIAVGDFNLVDNFLESAYQTLVNTTTPNYFIDPEINFGVGYHTFTTNRLPLQYRYDFIFNSESVTSLTDRFIDYIDNSFTVIGNDGFGRLTSSEFSVASDHLPVVAQYTFESVFPVELSLFTGNLVNNGIELNWRTETEVNNYGFEVERALSSTTPLQGWEKIGFVNGNGNSNSPKNYSFLDESKLSSGTIYYRLKQIDNDGQYEYSKEISVDLGVPSTFSLSQNYPNPFNPSTKISYTLPIDTKVSIKVYDVLGNLVETLVDEQKEAGYYEANFNVQGLSSGIYFYTISADNFNQTKKMTLLK